MSNAPHTEEPTIGRLVADASRDVSALLQSEIALAKSEVKVSVKAGGIGAALLAVAGAVTLRRRRVREPERELEHAA